MAYYNICPECGAYLDPGETCDCVFQREYKRKQEMKVAKRRAAAERLAEQEGMWEQQVLAI